jgi:hypothetical protein
MNFECFFARPAAYELCKIDGSCITLICSVAKQVIWLGLDLF